MNQDRKPRCQDIPKAIIEYFRSECAIFSSDGIETTSYKLAESVGSSQAPVASHLKRLMEFGIIILKSGNHIPSSRSPKFFTLGEGYEEGDEWRKIYYGSKQAPTPQKSVTKPTLPSEIVKASIKATNDKILREELIQTYARIKELQEKVISVQQERDKALAIVQKQTARIEELEQDLKIEAESAQRNQEELTTLELQLREARSQVAGHDRRIAKNDQTCPVFAASTR